MKFKEYNPTQSLYKIIIPDELLDENDPARIISKIVEKLNLDKLYERYKEVGNTAYHPKMMLKILFYSYYLGIHSCRKIWESLKKRADYIYLSGDQVPDFRTINDFRIRHLNALPDIFTQIVMLCDRLDMIGFEHLAIDGQKIHANASFRKTYNRKRLEKRYKSVKEGIEKILKENPDLCKEASQSDSQDTLDSRKKKRKLELEKRKLEKLKELFDKMSTENHVEEQSNEDKKEAETTDNVTHNETDNPSLFLKTTEDKTTEDKTTEDKTTEDKTTEDKTTKGKDIMINMTDSESSQMRHKDGTSKPSYNHQSAIDDKYGVTVALQTVLTGDKDIHLLPIVDQAILNTNNRFFKNITADAGFCSYELLSEVLKRIELFYIPDQHLEISKSCFFRGKYNNEQFKLEENGIMKCPAGNDMHLSTNTSEKQVYTGVGCESCPLKKDCTDGKKRSVTIVPGMEDRDIMRKRLNTVEGKKIYSKRQGTVEPTHGDDQKNKGWRQHHLRGLANAAAEFTIIRIASNIGKIIRFKATEFLALA